MEACNVSGAGSVTATGGQSVAGSGAGGGGRISIRAGLVSPELVDCRAMLECVCDAPVALALYTRAVAWLGGKRGRLW